MNRIKNFCSQSKNKRGILMNHTAEKIGSRVKIFRERSGFTQRNIANYLQIDQSLVSMVEKGKQVLTADMLEKLADLFGVPLSAFESEEIEKKTLSFAFRASDLNETDMETIRVINRIALNSKFMTQLLEKGNRNG